MSVSGLLTRDPREGPAEGAGFPSYTVANCLSDWCPIAEVHRSTRRAREREGLGTPPLRCPVKSAKPTRGTNSCIEGGSLGCLSRDDWRWIRDGPSAACKVWPPIAGITTSATGAQTSECIVQHEGLTKRTPPDITPSVPVKSTKPTLRSTCCIEGGRLQCQSRDG
jgi:hypothetical protein